ncbi:cupin domain-containing protein [Haloarcula salinisoli]|uniref:Cupin domain-containing protein n=1 Tax=Haloarcula salinisoli TaxID=2487746 RepID=A0A8J7YK64_9EURY|nr:cupin domain-containing protein [Halomicroarcula salinisoli]MBX0304614.1 cupin domain-containing protein [Halomicroarcula salinisoli]
MAYHHIDPAELPETEDYPCDRRGISDAAELLALHAATYEMAPGEQLPRSYHYHKQREELFYVVSGPVHVETPEGEFAVETGEVFVAEPESPHRAFVPEDADQSARVLGVGAPKSDPGLPYEPDE